MLPVIAAVIGCPLKSIGSSRSVPVLLLESKSKFSIWPCMLKEDPGYLRVGEIPDVGLP